MGMRSVIDADRKKKKQEGVECLMTVPDGDESSVI